MLAGGIVMLIAAAPAVALVLAALGGPQIVTTLVILREGSGRYRTHCKEGKFSQHYTMTVTVGVDPLGTHVAALAELYGELKPFRGKVFQFTTSEYRSAVLLMEAIESHPAYRLLVAAFEELQHVSEDSLAEGIEEEIALRTIQLRPAMRPLADFLYHHDGGRVAEAA